MRILFQFRLVSYIIEVEQKVQEVTQAIGRINVLTGYQIT